MKHNLKYIVTGTGRSGTVFMAKFLTDLGIPCGHESIFNQEPFNQSLVKLYIPQKRTLSFCSTHDFKNETSTEKWVDPSKTIAESSYMAAPYLHLPELIQTKVIHIIRSPLKVISSFIKSLNYFEHKNLDLEQNLEKKLWHQKIYKTIPELFLIDNQIDRACFFYCKWNDLIKEKSKNKIYIKCKIETRENNMNFYSFIEKPPEDLVISKSTNSIKDRDCDFKLNDISNSEIKKMIKSKLNEYGYI